MRTSTFTRDEHRGAGVLEPRSYPEHFLNLGRGSDNAVDRGLGIDALAEKFVLLDQPYFLGHPSQEQPQLFERRKWFGDVVVSAKFHGLHGGLDGTVAGHQSDFGSRQEFFHLFEKLEARHVRHHHVAEDHVDRLLFQQRERGFAAIGFEADESEGFAHGYTQFADALLIIDDQQTNPQLVLAKRRFTRRDAHCDLPMVFSTAEIRSCTRNGFSKYSAPILRRVLTVSSLA